MLTVPDAIQKVELLVKNIEKWKGSGQIHYDRVIDGKYPFRSFERWVQQAKLDPSFDVSYASEGKMIDAWVEALENHVRQVGRRFECAKLFGELFKEWLASGDSSTTVSLDGSVEESDSATTRERPGSSNSANIESDDFVDVGRIERVEQKEKFGSIVFEEFSTDTEALNAYLEELFSGYDAQNALSAIRQGIKRAVRTIQRSNILPNDVKNSIRGLLSSGLMDETKRATLKEMLNNETVQKEVANVLNMRMSNLENWNWPEGGVVIELRRHLNGKYRSSFPFRFGFSS
ncbi:hypothetical protein AX16_005701 [Volvariella volvacea WC 439]|nr:hypothetical protein AX16_005701 [Volvariella volvacea WC 439]